MTTRRWVGWLNNAGWAFLVVAYVVGAICSVSQTLGVVGLSDVAPFYRFSVNCLLAGVGAVLLASYFEEKSL